MVMEYTFVSFVLTIVFALIYGIRIGRSSVSVVPSKIVLEPYRHVGGDRPSDVAIAAKAAQQAGFIAQGQRCPGPCSGDSGCLWPRLWYRRGLQRACSQALARALAKLLEPLEPMFIEESVLVENMEAFREITRHTTIPIATGERLFSRWDYKGLLRDGYVDIVQPDLSHAECKKIASMAEAYDVALAPHCPLLWRHAWMPPVIMPLSRFNYLHYNQGADLLWTISKTKRCLSTATGWLRFPRGPGSGWKSTRNSFAKRRKLVISRVQYRDIKIGQ
ncbi:enolase C-terminal domain-like protein [Jimgerdemannia flammicorona]|uniref:Enolase C-terminal domain-like protein n=1 Tax=Jimgerdemannia flammicorona TaxID=994334 RepID=A0A432ZZR3_9FUNG|nr:enolase C-terminal domain-like protein [Jimgerdemannia flammicorona]